MDRHTLARILAQHAGKPLTLEVGRQILEAACPPDAPLDVGQFEPQVSGEYRIAVERFADALPELIPLHSDHWAETERWRAGIPLDPDYGAMLERDRVGRLLQVTLRHNGELVGHVRMYLHRSLHTSSLYGEEDTLYITPAHRGGFVVMRMMRYAEACLRAIGCLEIRANSKLINSADVLMRRLGYTPVALQFCKVFEDRHEPAT